MSLPSQITSDAAAPPAIQVEEVTKTYPRSGLIRFSSAGAAGTTALSAVSLTVREGETVGLLGPNGAGKTTLLKIIATLLYPSSGRVLMHGRDMVREPGKVRGTLGLVTCDERSFYWRLSGHHNLSFFAALYGLSKKKGESRVTELLEALGLAFAADRPFHSYSSGMKQKLAIARGLLADPRVVLYDEPTRSLDPLSVHNIRSWLAENRSPHTSHLIATNQLPEAEQLCDRVVILNRGVVIAAGTIQQIRDTWRRSQHLVHRITCRKFAANGLLRSVPAEGLLELVQEDSDDERLTLRARTIEGSEALSRLLERILSAGGGILRCQTEEAPFEEVFRALVLEDQAASRTAPGGKS